MAAYEEQVARLARDEEQRKKEEKKAQE